MGNDFTTGAAETFTLPRLTVRRSTTMDEFRKVVNGQATFSVRRDRMLTKGFSVGRRGMSTLRIARQPAWYREAEA